MTFIMAMLAMVMQAGYPPSRSAACAGSDKVDIAPADMLQLLDDFRNGLTDDDRELLDRSLPRSAAGGITQCDASTGSRASCEAAAYMPALRRTGLMPRFLATICPKPAVARPTDGSAPTFIPHHAMPPR